MSHQSMKENSLKCLKYDIDELFSMHNVRVSQNLDMYV